MKPTPTTATPAMKTINGKKCVRVDGLEKPETPKPADLGIAAFTADVRRAAAEALAKADAIDRAALTARQAADLALAKAENNEKRVETLEKHIDAAESIVKSAANIAEEASEAVDRVKPTARQAADLAKENADIIRGEIERLARLSEHVDRVENDAIARQQDNAARIQTLEEHARAVDWTLAAVSVLGVAAHVVRLLHRR